MSLVDVVTIGVDVIAVVGRDGGIGIDEAIDGARLWDGDGGDIDEVIVVFDFSCDCRNDFCFNSNDSLLVIFNSFVEDFSCSLFSSSSKMRFLFLLVLDSTMLFSFLSWILSCSGSNSTSSSSKN